MLEPELAGGDSAIVDTIGEYEEWAPLRGERAMGPVYVGSDGMLSRYSGTVVLWTAIRRLAVTRTVDPTGAQRVSLIADTGPEGLELTLATTVEPDPEFNERARSIADLLRHFLSDHDVYAATWPVIELG